MVDGVVVDLDAQMDDASAANGDEHSLLRRRLREALAEKAELEKVLQVGMRARVRAGLGGWVDVCTFALMSATPVRPLAKRAPSW